MKILKKPGMKKKELGVIGCDYYLSIKQVARLEKCSVQNIYSRIQGKKSAVSYFSYWGNIYHRYRFGEVVLFSPAITNKYWINYKCITLDEWDNDEEQL